MTNLRGLLLDTRDGEWGKGDAGSDRVKMRVIRGTDFPNVRQGAVDGVPERYLERRHADRKRLKLGDIIIETAGGSPDRPTGRTILVTSRAIDLLGPDVTCASFARYMRVDPDKAHPEYLFWLLQHHYDRRDLLQFHTQHTGVARFQFTTFSNSFEFELPSRGIQRRIAAILGAYDDLIEVNRRRVAVLEEMARGLFEEWFVRFRFPGYEAVPIGESALGPLPEGWTLAKGKALLSYLGGGTPSKDNPDYWAGGTLNWFTPTDLTKGGVLFFDSSALKITERGLAGSSAKLFEAGSVMMTSRATLGVFGINNLPATTNQGFITFRPTVETPVYYLLQMLRQAFPRMEAVATGATFKEITKGALGDLLFVKPPPVLVEKYELLATAEMETIRNLTQQGTALREARDLLLPRLISGQLSFSAAERELEAVA